jgi:hypothetical protein
MWEFYFNCLNAVRSSSIASRFITQELTPGAIAPSELKHVREAISTLLSIAPTDVFSVMIDDFRGSEQETGASRRNILEFLIKEAEPERRKFLESGDYPEVESTVRRGFADIIQDLGWEERIKILTMLGRFSSISGKKAKAEAAEDYLRLMRKALRSGEGLDRVEKLIEVSEDFLSRKPSVDPRAVIVFFTPHAEGILGLAIEREHKIAQDFLTLYLSGWIDDSLKAWRSGSDKDYAESKVAPDFCDTILHALRVSTS